MKAPTTGPTFLLSPPDYFEVSYVINPWMHPDDWKTNRESYRAACKTGWEQLKDALLKAGARILILPAAVGNPDMVFTANAAVALDGIALLAHFRHPERQSEEPHIRKFFDRLQATGAITRIRTPPPGLCFEGAGDAIWDASRRLMWMGYGPRTDLAMRDVIADIYNVPVEPLRLVDPRFYHLDTALCVLSGGEILYYPPAFDAAARAALAAAVPAHLRISLSDADAQLIAANGVSINRIFISGGMTPQLKAELMDRGYSIVTPAIATFAKSGGSAYCLTLRLDRTSGLVTSAPALITAPSNT